MKYFGVYERIQWGNIDVVISTCFMTSTTMASFSVVISFAVFLLFAAADPAGFTSHPDDCVLFQHILTCRHTIPEIIPSTATEVFVQEYNASTIPEQSFNDVNWMYVTTLDVTVVSSWFMLSSYNFRNLGNLRRLGIHVAHVEVERYSFSGLSNMSHLDLSYCMKTNQSTLFQALLDGVGVLQGLKSINLEYMNSENAKVIRIDETFSMVMETFAIEDLYLSGTNLIITLRHPPKLKWYLKTLDASNTFFIQSLEVPLKHEIRQSLLGNLEFLNISDNPARLLGVADYISEQNKHLIYEQVDCQKLIFPVIPFVFRLKYLFADSIFQGPIVVTNVTVDLSHCDKYDLQVLHLRRNGLSKLNITLKAPGNPLRELDLAYNNIHYISPNFLQDSTQLKILVLRDNNLSNMEHFPEFEQLLHKQTKLIQLDISLNQLSCIPFKMFIHNTQLKDLDLSRNSLQTITFSLANLTDLRTLKLHNNRLSIIGSEYLVELQSLFTNQIGINNSMPVELYNNPFLCNCANLELLEWLVGEFIPRSNQTIMCDLDNKLIGISQSAIDQAKQTCKSILLPKLFWIVLSVYIFAVFVIVMLFFNMLIKDKVKKRDVRLRNSFIQTFKKGESRLKHIVFLSENIDSADEGDGVAFCQTVQNLERELLNKIGSRVINNVVISDNAYGPIGVYRDEAAESSIADSYVVVILISTAEPDNRYFKKDLELAKAHNKPICLLSRPVADNERPSLRQYAKYPTFELEQHGGVWAPKTGWGKLGEFILTMAAKQHNATKELSNQH